MTPLFCERVWAGCFASLWGAVHFAAWVTTQAQLADLAALYVLLHETRPDWAAAARRGC